MFHHLLWFDFRLKVHYSLTILVNKISGEIPRDIIVRSLLFEVLEEGAGFTADDFLLFDDWERDLVRLEKPGPNLLIRIWFFFSELVAGNCDDSEASSVIFVVHLFVLAIVLFCIPSLRSHIDNDRGSSSSICIVMVDLLNSSCQNFTWIN